MEGYCQSAAVRVLRQGLRAMMTELEARLALVCASTDDGRALTLRRYKFNMDGG